MKGKKILLFNRVEGSGSKEIPNAKLPNPRKVAFQLSKDYDLSTVGKRREKSLWQREPNLRGTAYMKRRLQRCTVYKREFMKVSSIEGRSFIFISSRCKILFVGHGK